MRTHALLAIAIVAAAGCGPEPRPADPEQAARAAAAAPAAGEGVAARAADPAPPALRLPGDVVPRGYELELALDADQESFSGRVLVDVEVVQGTRYIWMHGEDLVVTSARIAGDPGASELRPLSTSGGGWLGFEAAAPLVQGTTARLELVFTGHVATKSPAGLFRQQDGGRWYLYSQFQAISARRAFPCFDEPAFKVPWTVTITAPAGQRVYSNSPVVRDEPEGAGHHRVEFAPTPPIPSYLVAVAVGPFEEVAVGEVGREKVPARILVPAGRSGEAAAAARVMPKIVTALEDYFDMPLPFPKLDSVAVPSFFGAMENPGLVTYDAGILLATSDDETERFRQRLTSIAGHELAHQWFGNYVTLAWWDDTWLNESFATWMAEKVANAVEPNWDRAARAVETAQRAMAVDARLTAPPLHRPIQASGDIETAFDAIAYSKGGAVLTMFERWIGEVAFRDGVRAYMKAHARGSATSADFIAALEAASTPEVGGALRTFLDQPGVPLVHASLDCRAGEAPRVLLRQERLVGFADAAPAQTWPMRACVHSDGGEACATFAGAEVAVVLEGARACPRWVVANAGGAGYYRVAYDDDLRARLAKNLRRVPAVERMALAFDQAALLEVGRVGADDALALVGPLVATGDGHDLSSAVALVAATERLVADDLLPAWRRWVVRRFGAAARKAPLRPSKGEAPAAHEARLALLELVGVTARDRKLAARARAAVEPWLADKVADAPADLGLLLAIAARHGDAALFDRFLAKAKATEDRRVRGALLGALGSFTAPELVARSQELVLGGGFDVYEVGAILQAQLATAEGGRAVGAFVRANWDAITASLPRMALPYVIYMQGAVCDAESRAEVDAFVRSRAASIPGGEKAHVDTVAQIDQCIARRAALSGDVAAVIGAAR